MDCKKESGFIVDLVYEASCSLILAQPELAKRHALAAAYATGTSVPKAASIIAVNGSNRCGAVMCRSAQNVQV